MKSFTFGQYFPSTSFVHKMDARIKILISIAFLVAVFMVKGTNNNFHFLGFLICFSFVIVAIIFSKVPIKKVFSNIKTIMFFVVFSSVIQIFFNKSGTPLWKGGFITDAGLYNALFIIARIILVVLGASILTLTTSPVEIADGIESLLTPLKIIKFPVHEFALVMSIALRFIPTLLDETDRIIKAQSSRGANFEGGFIKKIKSLIPVLIPLLISSFNKADELADAMDARCYAGSKNRTKYKKMTLGYRDIIGAIVISVVIFGVVMLNGVLGVTV